MKCRQCGTKADIFDPQMQQSQQDTHSFLLIPGKHHGQRQIIHTAVKCICKSCSDLNGAVSVIALAYIHQTGQAVNRARIKVIETVFAAGQGQHYSIGWCLFHKFCITASMILSAS